MYIFLPFFSAAASAAAPARVGHCCAFVRLPRSLFIWMFSVFPTSFTAMIAFLEGVRGRRVVGLGGARPTGETITCARALAGSSKQRGWASVPLFSVQDKLNSVFTSFEKDLWSVIS